MGHPAQEKGDEVTMHGTGAAWRYHGAAWAAALRAAALPFLASRLLFLVVTVTAPWWRGALGLAHQRPTDPFGEATAWATGTLLDRWLQWDAYWYLHIAAHGYAYSAVHHSSVAFFPLYPLALRAASLVFAPLELIIRPGPALLISALLIANAATLLGLAALYRLALSLSGAQAARRAIWVACAFPTALFGAAPYSEGLFFLVTALFFLDLRNDRWGRAALWSFLAALCRPLGILLAPCYLLALWRAHQARAPLVHPGAIAQHNPDAPVSTGPEVTPRIRRATPILALLGTLAAPAGLILYGVYLGMTFGHPLAFAQAHRAWGRAWAWPWMGLIESVRRPLAHLPVLSSTDWHALSDLTFTLVALAVSLAGWRLLRDEAALYLALFWLVTLCTPAILNGYPAPLSSMPRFALPIVPLLLIVAARPRLARAVIAVGGPWLLLNVAVFVNGGWVA